MHEVLEVIQDRYASFSKNQSFDRVEQVKVRNAIISLCRENLSFPDQLFTFEVMPDSLKYAVSVLDDPLITNSYYLEQVSESLFQASLVTVEVL